MTKTAIVLFNLGGPDKAESVQPFLFNLFNDPAIINVPSPFRWLLARLISKKRTPIAQEIYQQLGGGSPLVGQTKKQADALVKVLNSESQNHDFKAFIAMRYWHPMSLEAAEAVRDYAPDRIILLPLYPQYSITTTGSSLLEWRRAADMVGIKTPTRAICCYPNNQGWIESQALLLAEALKNDFNGKQPRILFSAHGLPKKIIKKGDPYQWQVEQTAKTVIERLKEMQTSAFSSSVCYQSRVGPLEWIGPSTDDELRKAGRDETPVIVVPIAFVSEHSETLVELDIEYRELAEQSGVPAYHRIPAVGTHQQFIEGLAGMVRDTLNSQIDDDDIVCDSGIRICPSDKLRCPLKAA